MDSVWVARLLVSAFFAVLFLQSGVDKVVDWGGNLGWLKGHFEKSPLRSVVPLLLGTITLVELAAGVVSAVGVYMVLSHGSSQVPVMGLALAGLALVMLFTGQRIAKDYPGAATLATYFGVVLIGLYISR